MNLEEYKAWYREQYGKNPTEKLLDSFCELNGIKESQKPIKLLEPLEEELESLNIGTGLEVNQALQMIIDMWDMGVTEKIKAFINQHNKTCDVEEMKIIVSEDGGISETQQLFVVREIAEKALESIKAVKV